MSTKIVELTADQKATVKRLAEQALRTRTTQAEDIDMAVSEDGARYIMATVPATTLGLLAEVERLTGEAAAERAERLTPEQLWKHYLAASYSVDPGAAWQHVSTGAVYEVLGVALREADCAPLVLYRLRDEGFVNPRRGVPTWARPASEFLDGRFVRVDE